MKIKPNCKRCVYYYITWNKDQPHGCKLYGFKSQQIPSLVIKRETRDDCKGYIPKN